MTPSSISNQVDLHKNVSNNLEITIISQLPAEKIFEIFSYLRLVDLRACTASVCKDWQKISKYFLSQAEIQECRNIRESVNFFSEKLNVILNNLNLNVDFVIDEDDEDEDENILRFHEINSLHIRPLALL